MRRHRPDAHRISVRRIGRPARRGDAVSGLRRRFCDWAGGRPVTIRTLDAGGDKPIAGLDGRWRAQSVPRPARHPALACAAGGLSRAAAGAVRVRPCAGTLKVMLPMVTVPAELEAVRDSMLDAEAVEALQGGRHRLRRGRRSASWSRCRRRRLRDRGFRRRVLFDRLERPDPVCHWPRRATSALSPTSNDAGHPAVLALIARTVEARRASAASRSRSAATCRRRSALHRRRCCARPARALSVCAGCGGAAQADHRSARQAERSSD